MPNKPAVAATMPASLAVIRTGYCHSPHRSNSRHPALPGQRPDTPSDESTEPGAVPRLASSHKVRVDGQSREFGPSPGSRLVSDAIEVRSDGADADEHL